MVLWNFDLIWENYVTMDKLWYFGETMVLFLKLWYYTENYGTILKIMKLRLTKEKKNVD